MASVTIWDTTGNVVGWHGVLPWSNREVDDAYLHAFLIDGVSAVATTRLLTALRGAVRTRALASPSAGRVRVTRRPPVPPDPLPDAGLELPSTEHE
eukprot:9087444-Pyramimonas_sp.AAC.1